LLRLTHQNQRNRVFAVFAVCNEYSPKNPVSGPRG
jgi:hypothetical protein